MNDIKYRVWDKERKVMQPVARITFGHEGAPTIIAEPAPVGGFYRGLVDRESGILMQFTGLKDKNGKDIYEGDIVKCGEFEDSIDAKHYTVIWGIGNYAAFDLDDWHGEANGLSEWLEVGVVEVIGNIYERPELLEAAAR